MSGTFDFAAVYQKGPAPENAENNKKEVLT